MTLIGRIGRLSSPDDYLNLHLLLREEDPILREAMHKVLPPLGIPVEPPKPAPPVKLAAKCRAKIAM